MKLTELIKQLEDIRDSYDKEIVEDVDVFAFSEKSFANLDVLGVKKFPDAYFVEIRVAEEDDE